MKAIVQRSPNTSSRSPARSGQSTRKSDGYVPASEVRALLAGSFSSDLPMKVPAGTASFWIIKVLSTSGRLQVGHGVLAVIVRFARDRVMTVAPRWRQTKWN